MPKILIGCDPELFLKNSKGEYVSAHNLLPGTKVEPFKVKGGAVQVDGVAAEFNTDPAETSIQFVQNIAQVMSSMQGMIPDVNFAIEPFAVFEPTYFNSLPSETKELGCDPDFNAWTGQVNPAPNGDNTTMRTASGHIHIGWCDGVNPHGKVHFEDCLTVVKQLDYYLGLYSLVWDKDNTRRQMYGKAGAFRPKSYGCEYRVLSNAWIKSQDLQMWVFNAAQTAVNSLFNGDPLVNTYGEFAKNCIDDNVTSWIHTKEGQDIHSKTGMSYPDYLDLAEQIGKKLPKKNVNY